jgi:1-acyl-sn-glycerol-3-phosphate acyltransferase
MLVVLRILRSIWIWGASGGLIVLWTPLVAVVRLFDRDPLHRRTARWFRRLGPVLAWINPWHVRVSGAEHIEAGKVYVIVSNHQSMADIPVLTHVRVDAKWMAKASLFRTPVIGWMLRMAGDIPVERADRRQAAQALLKCARHLRQGCSLLFFPEGTRSPDGRVLPFQKGPFHLAAREGVPVVPIAVHGSGNALPRGTWLFGGSHRIRVRVLEPVPSAGMDAEALRDTVRQRIVDELARMNASGVD